MLKKKVAKKTDKQLVSELRHKIKESEAIIAKQKDLIKMLDEDNFHLKNDSPKKYIDNDLAAALNIQEKLSQRVKFLEDKIREAIGMTHEDRTRHIEHILYPPVIGKAE